jgi:hypothetical protein
MPGLVLAILMARVRPAVNHQLGWLGIREFGHPATQQVLTAIQAHCQNLFSFLNPTFDLS